MWKTLVRALRAVTNGRTGSSTSSGASLRRALAGASAKAIWLGLAAILAVAIAASALRSSGGSRSHASGLLVGRLWIDHLPRSDTDHFEVFAAVEEGSVGVFQRASAYEGSYEIFKYEPRGEGKLQMLFPQSKKKADVKYEAKECTTDGFDYCLSLNGAPRGVSKYVSKKGWEVEADSEADLERAVDAWVRDHASTAGE